MSKKTKIEDTLCRLGKKGLEENMAAVVEVVSEPKFICEKCARVCKHKKLLCKPVKLPTST